MKRSNSSGIYRHQIPLLCDRERVETGTKHLFRGQIPLRNGLGLRWHRAAKRLNTSISRFFGTKMLQSEKKRPRRWLRSCLAWVLESARWISMLRWDICRLTIWNQSGVCMRRWWHDITFSMFNAFLVEGRLNQVEFYLDIVLNIRLDNENWLVFRSSKRYSFSIIFRVLV